MYSSLSQCCHRPTPCPSTQVPCPQPKLSALLESTQHVQPGPHQRPLTPSPLHAAAIVGAYHRNCDPLSLEQFAYMSIFNFVNAGFELSNRRMLVMINLALSNIPMSLAVCHNVEHISTAVTSCRLGFQAIQHEKVLWVRLGATMERVLLCYQPAVCQNSWAGNWFSTCTCLTTSVHSGLSGTVQSIVNRSENHSPHTCKAPGASGGVPIVHHEYLTHPCYIFTTWLCWLVYNLVLQTVIQLHLTSVQSHFSVCGPFLFLCEHKVLTLAMDQFLCGSYMFLNLYFTIICAELGVCCSSLLFQNASPVISAQMWRMRSHKILGECVLKPIVWDKKAHCPLW